MGHIEAAGLLRIVKEVGKAGVGLGDEGLRDDGGGEAGELGIKGQEIGEGHKGHLGQGDTEDRSDQEQGRSEKLNRGNTLQKGNENGTVGSESGRSNFGVIGVAVFLALDTPYILGYSMRGDDADGFHVSYVHRTAELSVKVEESWLK